MSCIHFPFLSMVQRVVWDGSMEPLNFSFQLKKYINNEIVYLLDIFFIPFHFITLFFYSPFHSNPLNITYTNIQLACSSEFGF